MTITITEKEFEAIKFARGQVQSEIEGASDEEFLKDASTAIEALYSVQDKYMKARHKANYFQSVRAEVSRKNQNRGLRPRDIDTMTRRIIKKSKEL